MFGLSDVPILGIPLPPHGVCGACGAYGATKGIPNQRVEVQTSRKQMRNFCTKGFSALLRRRSCQFLLSSQYADVATLGGGAVFRREVSPLPQVVFFMMSRRKAQHESLVDGGWGGGGFNPPAFAGSIYLSFGLTDFEFQFCCEVPVAQAESPCVFFPLGILHSVFLLEVHPRIKCGHHKAE